MLFLDVVNMFFRKVYVNGWTSTKKRRKKRNFASRQCSSLHRVWWHVSWVIWKFISYRLVELTKYSHWTQVWYNSSNLHFEAYISHVTQSTKWRAIITVTLSTPLFQSRCPVRKVCVGSRDTHDNQKLIDKQKSDYLNGTMESMTLCNLTNATNEDTDSVGINICSKKILAIVRDGGE